MAEYISREALLKAVEKMDRLDKETHTQYEYNKEGYILLIKNAPTADVQEVKHGKWQLGRRGRKIVCSCCESDVPFKKDHERKCHLACYSNYCPDCGAKMDGVDAE